MTTPDMKVVREETFTPSPGGSPVRSAASTEAVRSGEPCHQKHTSSITI
jgi:hypothetical protein